MIAKRRAVVLICLLVTVFGFLGVPARADAAPAAKQPAGIKSWFEDSTEEFGEWFVTTRPGKATLKGVLGAADGWAKSKEEGKSKGGQIWAATKGAWGGAKELPGAALAAGKDAVSSSSPSEIIKSAVTDALTDGFGQLAAQAADGVMGIITKPLSWLLATLGKMWINFTPILPDSAMGSKVTNKTASSFAALAGLLMVCSLMIGAAKIVITQRGEPLRDIARGLFTFVFMSSGWVSVCVLGLAGTDALAGWIAGPVKPDGLAKMVGYLAASNGPGGALTFGLMSFLLIIFVLIISLILMFQLALRGGILLILAGMGPIAGSFASTKIGWEWCQKIVAWTVAFMLFKPVGALIWSAALTLSNTPITDINDANSVTAFALTPLALLLGCVFAMPALMKLVMPATASALGSSDSSAGGMAAGMFGGALAGGASIAQFKMMSKIMGAPGSSGSSASGFGDTASGSPGRSSTSASGSGGTEGTNGSSTSASSSGNAGNASNASKAGGAGAAGSGGAAAGGAGGGAAAGGAAAGGASAGATAGAAAGPVGIVAGAAVGAAADGAKKAAAMTADAARSSAEGAVEYK